MTRSEIYQQIRANGLTEKANARAKEIRYWVSNANYTNLSNAELLGILDTVKSKKKTSKKAEATTQEFVDKGARRAIESMAAVLGMKDIKKNFF